MKIKVIDYLVKLANKEANNISIKTNDYFDEFFGNCRFQYIEDGLNSEVEIIEEEKKIPEKLNTWFSAENQYKDSIDYMNYNFKATYEKINEIIDYLKSKGE